MIAAGTSKLVLRVRSCTGSCCVLTEYVLTSQVPYLTFTWQLPGSYGQLAWQWPCLAPALLNLPSSSLCKSQNHLKLPVLPAPVHTLFPLFFLSFFLHAVVSDPQRLVYFFSSFDIPLIGILPRRPW